MPASQSEQSQPTNSLSGAQSSQEGSATWSQSIFTSISLWKASITGVASNGTEQTEDQKAVQTKNGSPEFAKAFEPFFIVAEKLFGVEGLRGKTLGFGLVVEESKETPEQAAMKRRQAMIDGEAEDAGGYLKELKTGFFHGFTDSANPDLASMPTKHVDRADLGVVVAFMMHNWKPSDTRCHHAVVSFSKKESWDESGIVSTVRFSSDPRLKEQHDGINENSAGSID